MDFTASKTLRPGPYKLLVHRKFYVQELPRELPGPIVLGQSDGATEKAGKKGQEGKCGEVGRKETG
jgi:hypothetical protein